MEKAFTAIPETLLLMGDAAATSLAALLRSPVCPRRVKCCCRVPLPLVDGENKWKKSSQGPFQALEDKNPLCTARPARC